MYSFVDNNSSKNNKISNNIISRKKRNKIEYLKHIKEKKKLLKKKKKNDKNKKDKKEQNQNQQQTEDSQYNFITDSNFKIEYFEQKLDFSKYQNISEMKQIYDSLI